jgi:hypothetical protein
VLTTTETRKEEQESNKRSFCKRGRSGKIKGSEGMGGEQQDRDMVFKKGTIWLY